MKRTQFTFYLSFWEALKALPKKDRLGFVMALGSYVFEDTLDEPTGAALASFLLVKPILDKASKKAANGKQGGSKPKANGKQTETSIKGEKEGEGEVEVEKERENDSSLPLTPSRAPKKPDWGFGPELTEAFSDWLRYKREKRQGYKPTGEANLVAQVRGKAQAYCESAVAELIRQSMAANYQGIVWDWLDKKPASAPARPQSGNVFLELLHEEAGR